MARIGKVSARSIKHLRVQFQRISSLRDLLFLVSLFLAVAISGRAVSILVEQLVLVPCRKFLIVVCQCSGVKV